MSVQDKLPVLAFPSRRTAPAPKDDRRAHPDDLARAMAALRAAFEDDAQEAELQRDTPRHYTTEEAFSPIGTPRPTWRASLKKGGEVTDTKGQSNHIASGPATERDALARRIVSIYLPRFSMERWDRWATRQPDTPPPDLPVVLAVEGPHGPVVHATNRAAEAQGLAAGSRVVDIRALCPEVRVEFANIAGDRMALDKLMLWARRWCPWTAVDGTSGLVMDTTGSDHLWGGEAQMLREMEERLSLLGFSANLAAASTHGAAWALARFGGVRRVVPPAALKAEIAPLPTRAMRIDADTELVLKRLGLKTVADVAAVPRISLARRFSRAGIAQNPLMRLDQIMGRVAEPVNAPDDPPRFAVQSQLPEPVQDPTPHLPSLCEELCRGLAAEGYGARRITVTVYRTDGEVSTLTAATARASRDPGHLLRLFDDKLERIDPGFGFDLITLGASVIEDMQAVQTRLDGAVDDGAELARLVDRLTARLGARAIRAPALTDSHMPERAEVWPQALRQAPRAVIPRPHRPARLFDTPEEIRVLYAVPEGPPAQFIWRRQTHRVTRFAGPERIAPEWWRDKPGTRLRDYYRIEDQHGRRYWIYRDGVLGDGRGETPRWFVHGGFA